MSTPAPAADGTAGRVVTGPLLRTPARLVPLVLAALGLVAVVYALAGVTEVTADPLHEVRVVVTVTFLLLGPGWAVAGFVAGRSLAQRFLLAAATGPATTILAGQAMVLSGAWHPVGLLCLLAAVSVPLLVLHVVRPR